MYLSINSLGWFVSDLHKVSAAAAAVAAALFSSTALLLSYRFSCPSASKRIKTSLLNGKVSLLLMKLLASRFLFLVKCLSFNIRFVSCLVVLVIISWILFCSSLHNALLIFSIFALSASVQFSSVRFGSLWFAVLVLTFF